MKKQKSWQFVCLNHIRLCFAQNVFLIALISSLILIFIIRSSNVLMDYLMRKLYHSLNMYHRLIVNNQWMLLDFLFGVFIPTFSLPLTSNWYFDLSGYLMYKEILSISGSWCFIILNNTFVFPDPEPSIINPFLLPPFPTSFSPVSCTNVGVSPQNILTFSFDPFARLV